MGDKNDSSVVLAVRRTYKLSTHFILTEGQMEGGKFKHRVQLKLDEISARLQCLPQNLQPSCTEDTYASSLMFTPVIKNDLNT
jgi:hypothetical protein